MKSGNKIDIAVLGDGGWGTALGIVLINKGYSVTVWGAFKDYIARLNKTRFNKKFLPGIRIPKGIKFTADLAEAVSGKQIIILAVPSLYLRQVLNNLKVCGFPRDALYLSVIKGIETGSLKRMSEVIREELGNIKLAVLSGPTIAHEVACGIPTTVVVASHDSRLREYLQSVFMTERLRVYTNDDVTGVELGGSLKNVIAIACGISDGLGFGTNTKAALLSRGLVEISRLGVSMGAKAKTFSGISGLGDLVTTCISQYSRNRFVGEEIGKGKTIKEIKSHMQMVAEGITTAKSAHGLSLRYKVDMPIIREVYRVIYGNKSAKLAVKDLMTRERKPE